MSIFRKEIDVLDLPDLQRRGLLKKTENSPKENIQTDKAGYVDLSAPPTQITPETTIEPQNPFSFLDSPQTPPTSFFSAPTVSSSDNTEIEGLKNKIEDLEYKLDRLMEKIAKLEGG